MSDAVIPCKEYKVSSLLSTSTPLDVTTLPSTPATSNVQTVVESLQLGASVSFTFPRPLGVLVAVLFAVGSEGLATALKSEGFVVLHISEPTGRSTRSSADFFFPVGLGGQSAEKIFNLVLEWDDLAFVLFKPASSTFVKKKQNWRTAEFALGVPDLCCAPREYLRVHDENVGMKTAAQRLEKCASKNIPTLFEASATSLVWTIFSVPLSSYNSASFALCAVGGDRSKRIRLAGAHFGDSLLHDRPCSKDHHHAHWSLPKSEEADSVCRLCQALSHLRIWSKSVRVYSRVAARPPDEMLARDQLSPGCRLCFQVCPVAARFQNFESSHDSLTLSPLRVPVVRASWMDGSRARDAYVSHSCTLQKDFRSRRKQAGRHLPLSRSIDHCSQHAANQLELFSPLQLVCSQYELLSARRTFQVSSSANILELPNFSHWTVFLSLCASR